MTPGYELADFLAWDAASWDRLLGAYHLAIWPAQLVASLLFIAALWIASISNNRLASVPLMLVLAASWAFVGWCFHGQHHGQLNWAAHYWAVACGVQAVLLLAFAAMGRDRPRGLPGSVWWFACIGFVFCSPVLIGLGWGRSTTALAWPIVSPDALAWITLFVFAVRMAINGTRADRVLLIIPALLLIVDGLIAYALPAYDRLVIVALALLSTMLVALVGKSIRQPIARQ